MERDRCVSFSALCLGNQEILTHQISNLNNIFIHRWGKKYEKKTGMKVLQGLLKKKLNNDISKINSHLLHQRGAM